jgi:hypothetical protein
VIIVHLALASRIVVRERLHKIPDPLLSTKLVPCRATHEEGASGKPISHTPAAHRPTGPKAGTWERALVCHKYGGGYCRCFTYPYIVEQRQIPAVGETRAERGKTKKVHKEPYGDESGITSQGGEE